MVVMGPLAVAGLAWAYTKYLAMGQGAPGTSMVMPQIMAWSAFDFGSMFLRWALMMTATMVPTAEPMILTFSNLPFDEWTEAFGSERLTGALLVWLRHRHRQKAKRDYRKEAKQRLAALINTYRQDNNLQGLSMQVNQLLKQICLSAISPKAARLIDDAWVDFLNQQLNPSSTSLQHSTHIFLVKQPYTTNALLTPGQIDGSLADIKNWLEQHRGELLNVNL